MAPQELEGGTLGEKHQNYNKRLRESDQLLDDNDNSDINTLLKIDIACRNKDIEYIMNILKGEDMLYVSRVLTRCTWLYAEDYANIINPEYLESQLFPNMTTKAMTKFKKQIRRNLKDESRAEQFYLKETNKIEACKWLPYCSVAFIEGHIETHVNLSQQKPMKHRLFKRLCEKSVTIFERILQHLDSYNRHEYLQVVTFLLNSNVDKYLDVLENTKYRYPKLSHKATELIMKHSKTRVIEKMHKYVSVIHLPTFVQYLKVDEIKNFLYLQAKKDLELYEYSDLRRLFQSETLKLFINKLPKDEQFAFVQKVCIQKDNEDTFFEDFAKETGGVESNAQVMNRICGKYCKQKSYVWYQFAPFDHAFNEITKLISKNVEDYEKLAMFSVLIKCANKNLENVKKILQYYVNKQKNEDVSTNVQFVTEVMNRTNVSDYDEEAWNILNKLFKSINVYDSSNHYVSSTIVNFIIIYNIINNQKPAEVIETRFEFETFKNYKTKMNEAQKDKLFSYLYEHLEAKINTPIVTGSDYSDSIKAVKHMLQLLNDWDKALLDYPMILTKIKESIRLKKEHSWKANLSIFYNTNKSWRKHMFEESIALCPGEEVCLNALKHEPQLLKRYDEEMSNLKADDTISLKRFLAKLRIYWPHTLGQEWTDVYLANINETKGQKVTIQGIIAMLSREPLFNMIEKYKPTQPKIDWKQADDRVISVQRLIAKNMHRARPQPAPETILLYAKGDYLQSALPSLLAMFHNLQLPMVRQYIPKLLDAPVSLQKHGIRIAFKKFNHEELNEIFLNCWNTSKNSTIRSIIFKYTHTLLCNEKDAIKATSLWELLETFIDNLTFTEDKDIYKLFDEVERVPLKVRGNYLIKTYNFLQKLIPKLEENDRSQYQWICTKLAAHSRVVMETISPDFVTTIIEKFIDEQFFNVKDKMGTSVHSSDDMVRVISAYLLCSTNETEQIKKYENVFVPLMHRSFEKWGEKPKGKYFVRQNFDQLLTRLSYDLKDYVIEKNMMIPLKMFTLILQELEKSLSVTECYMILTKWKLTVTLAKLIQEYSKENNKIIPLEFGKICLEYLKQDVQLHFPCIYVLFAKCVKQIEYVLTPEDAMLGFYDPMLSDKDFIQGYLASIEIGVNNSGDEKYGPIWKQIVSHPSVEVKMHYYNKIDEKEN